MLIAGAFNNYLYLGDSKDMNCRKNVMNLHNLIPCSITYKSKIKYTFRNNTRDGSPFIDNIVFDKKLLKNINYVDIINDVTNFRDHLAIICHFYLKNIHNDQTNCAIHR